MDQIANACKSIWCWHLALAGLGIWLILKLIFHPGRVGNNGNRYILITGCDSGFGNLLAKRLDSIGCHVFAACLTQQGASELAQSTSSRVTTFMMNVTQQDDIEKAYHLVKNALPDGQGLWGVVNNAGILRIGLIDWMPIEEYKKVVDVNVWGVVAVTKRFIPLVIGQQGRFVNVVSLSGVLPWQSMGAYTISKFATEGFTGVLRREMAPFNVKVSSIKPGVFRSPLVTPQPLEDSFRKMYQNLPPESLENYDEEFVSAIPKMAKSLQENGSTKLYLVVNAIEDALLSKRPKADYYIGVDSVVLSSLLHFPSGWTDYLCNLLLPSTNPSGKKRTIINE